MKSQLFAKLKSFYVSIVVIQVIYFNICTKGAAHTSNTQKPCWKFLHFFLVAL